MTTVSGDEELERRLATVAVGLILAAGLAHGLPHVAVPVPLADWQAAYVLLSSVLGPLAALALVWRGRVRAGGALLAASMAAAFAFGLSHHFLLANPDNVAAVPAGVWQRPFQATAALVETVELVGLLAGVWLYRRTDA